MELAEAEAEMLQDLFSSHRHRHRHRHRWLQSSQK
jgi:hypothetical protein